MERNNNTYGDLINNKFSELLSADMNTTWKGMREILDSEIPEKNRKKWLLWFSTRPGIIAIVLFSLFAAAAGAYIGIGRDEQENNSRIPAKEIKNEINIEGDRLKNDESLNLNNIPEKIITEVERETKTSSLVQIKDKEVIKTSERNKTKINNSPAPVIRPMPAKQKSDRAAARITPAIHLQAKDSVCISAETAQTEVVERRRAF